MKGPTPIIIVAFLRRQSTVVDFINKLQLTPATEKTAETSVTMPVRPYSHGTTQKKLKGYHHDGPPPVAPSEKR
jgi:hypothetical protein